MKLHLRPSTIAKPLARYSHGVMVDCSRLLVLSGQLGLSVEGRIPSGAFEQTQICFANIDALLAAAGMTRRDVVRINAFVSDRVYLADYMAVRDQWIAELDEAPASTLMIVCGFARQEFKVEVEVTAAS